MSDELCWLGVTVITPPLLFDALVVPVQLADADWLFGEPLAWNKRNCTGPLPWHEKVAVIVITFPVLPLVSGAVLISLVPRPVTWIPPVAVPAVKLPLTPPAPERLAGEPAGEFV